MKREELIGKRVRLILMSDDYPIQPGTEGIILRVDEAETIYVQWDDERILGLIQGMDQYEILD